MQPIFARIVKVDEATRTVTGRAAQEMVDRSGEIFDYKTSKPEFQKWSAEVHADSQGKSWGNVRSMHGNVAAGKLTDISFNDVEKAVDITAKIIDEQEWEKVCEGVHTGFSIGGTYKNKMPEVMNGKMVTRYTAIPSEISLVDRPCIPTAKFDFTKQDGSTVRKRFKTSISKSAIEFSGGKVTLSKTASIDAIRKVHSQGARPMSPDFLRKGVEAPTLHKAQAAARQLMQKRVRTSADGGRFRKVGFPPQSSNIGPSGAIADTGASNNWKDQKWNPPKPTMLGGHAIGTPAKSNMDAVLDALKQDMSNPKRL